MSNSNRMVENLNQAFKRLTDVSGTRSPGDETIVVRKRRTKKIRVLGANGCGQRERGKSKLCRNKCRKRTSEKEEQEKEPSEIFSAGNVSSNVQGKHVRPQPEEVGGAQVVVNHGFQPRVEMEEPMYSGGL